MDAVLYTNKHAGSAKKRRELRGHQILLATSGVASLGLNIPELDFLFLTGLESNKVYVDQAVGRVSRVIPGKKRPIVVDYDDTRIPEAHEAALRRRRRYEQRGWDVTVLPVRKILF